MTRNALRALGEDEKPPEAPKTLSDAVDLDRRALLVRGRLEIAKQIDAGVPAHALGRLISTMNELDTEIRRLDSADEEESRRAGTSSERRSFNATAI